MHDGLICIFFDGVISTVIQSLDSHFFRKHAVNIRPTTYIYMVSSSSVKYSLENNLLLLFFFIIHRYHVSNPFGYCELGQTWVLAAALMQKGNRALHGLGLRQNTTVRPGPVESTYYAPSFLNKIAMKSAISQISLKISWKIICDITKFNREFFKHICDENCDIANFIAEFLEVVGSPRYGLSINSSSAFVIIVKVFHSCQ